MWIHASYDGNDFSITHIVRHRVHRVVFGVCDDVLGNALTVGGGEGEGLKSVFEEGKIHPDGWWGRGQQLPLHKGIPARQKCVRDNGVLTVVCILSFTDRFISFTDRLASLIDLSISFLHMFTSFTRLLTSFPAREINAYSRWGLSMQLTL